METGSENTSRAIDRIFKARSIAVVGASGDPRKLGHKTMDSIVRGGYEGKIYPINPRGGELFGLKIYKSIQEIPEPPDLAVIVVPANHVPAVLREASNKGTKGAVILSAGFREAGRHDLEEQISLISREGGIRFVGPNVQGINYLPNKLCAMFFPVITKRGPLTIIAQSGSVTAGLSEWAAEEGLGICAAVNLGNQTDLCESDYIEYFADDVNTKAIALYAEGLKDGFRFLDTISRVGSKKPIVILKGGKTRAGQKAVRSHTGSLAGSREIFDAACRQYGMVSAVGLDHLYDCAKALATMRKPAGNRVLSISTSGGMGTVAIDEAEAEGLSMPPLPDAFIESLRALDVSPLANLANPLDMGVITAEDFQRIVMLAEQANAADIVLLNLGDPVPGIPEVAQFLLRNTALSLAVSYMGGGEAEREGRVSMLEMGIPVFTAPDRAMRGIGAVIRWGHHRRRKGFPPRQNRDGNALSQLTARFVPEPEAVALLGLRMNYPEHGLAKSPQEAVCIADRIGYPVVLKVVSSHIQHKSDVGGVVTGLQTSHGVQKEFPQMVDRIKGKVPGASIEGIMVCKEEPPGLDFIVGAIHDPVFGPTVMFGSGGIFTEVLRDTTFRIAPLDHGDAEEMVRGIKGYSLIKGVRGQTAYEVDKLIELILRVSQLIMERPYVKELDLNPVRLCRDRISILDVRLLVAGNLQQAKAFD